MDRMLSLNSALCAAQLGWETQHMAVSTCPLHISLCSFLLPCTCAFQLQRHEGTTSGPKERLPDQGPGWSTDTLSCSISELKEMASLDLLCFERTFSACNLNDLRSRLQFVPAFALGCLELLILSFRTRILSFLWFPASLLQFQFWFFSFAVHCMNRKRKLCTEGKQMYKTQEDFLTSPSLIPLEFPSCVKNL